VIDNSAEIEEIQTDKFELSQEAKLAEIKTKEIKIEQGEMTDAEFDKLVNILYRNLDLCC